MLALTLTLLSNFVLSISTPLHPRVNGPKRVLARNFPDPGLIQASDGWYAFATNDGKANIPIAKSADFDSGWKYLGADVLPTLPSWAVKGQTWAPDVLQRDDGQFIMYFAAGPKDKPAAHCIGTATASNVTGPYDPQPKPLACDQKRGGLIDPAGFRHSNGTYYLVYKTDQNSLGHGGNCKNTKPPILPTPIMLQKLQNDALTPDGAPIQILDRDASDGPLVEAPSLIELNGKFVLFFSSNCYATPLYDTSYAYSNAIEGPYKKIKGNEQPKGVVAPLLKTGSFGLNAPGGWTISKDGTKAVFHANLNGKNIKDGRAMYNAHVNISSTSWGSLVTIV